MTLPPWAEGPRDYVIRNREALESNYASANLHKWIDLIFGHLSRNERASLANNLFQATTYEDNIDWS